jgi:hypothetical protein
MSNGERRFTRSKMILDKLSTKVGLTEDGKNWLIAALDPFHDEKLMFTGYPDRAVSPSIAMERTLSRNLTNANLKSLTTQWGFFVMATDKLSHVINVLAKRFGNLIILQPSTQVFVDGGLVIVKFNMDYLTNNPAWRIDTAGTTAGDFAIDESLTLEQTYMKGRSRACFSGFEITDTTPPLYKGGLMTLWEQPQANQDKSVHLFAGAITPSLEVDKKERKKQRSLVPGDYFAVRSLVISPVPPDNISEMLLLKGTKQWAAQKGCYAVQTMSDLENPPRVPDASGDFNALDETAIEIPYEALAANYVAGYTEKFSYTSPFFDVDTNIDVGQMPANKRIPFNRKGVLVTGLLPEASFTVNWKVGVERFPTQDEADIVVLAKPSPSEDYMAAQIYSEIVQKMPVACFVDENDFGEWFSGIVDSIAEVASPIAKGVVYMTEEWKNRKSTPSVNTNTGSITKQAPQITHNRARMPNLGPRPTDTRPYNVQLDENRQQLAKHTKKQNKKKVKKIPNLPPLPRLPNK